MDAIKPDLDPPGTQPRAFASVWAAVAMLAAAYYVSGKLGLLLAIPPGYATAVWPPAGIALAGLLILGYRAWPGVLLGSFLINMGVAASGAGWTAGAVALAVTIGAGASLQAAAGAFLVRRFVGFPMRFEDEIKVWRFLLLAGPASGMVNATIAVSALWYTGAVSASDYAFNWWTWWVGDVIGALVFAPLVLLWTGRGLTTLWTQRRLFVTLPMVVAFAAIVAVFVYASEREQERVRVGFERQAHALAGNLKDNLQDYIEALYAVESLYAASAVFDRREFGAFVKRRLQIYPGIQALEWVPRVPAAERAAYERAAQGEGFAGFRITERDAQRRLVRAAVRAEYFPVYYVEPYLGNEGSLGFDLASNPARRAALEQARDRGQPVASEAVQLVQDVDERPGGFLVGLPIYAKHQARDDIETRRRNLRGFALGVFRIRDVVTTARSTLFVDGIVTRIYDLNAPAGNHLLYEQGPQDAAGISDTTAILQLRKTLPVAGRNWTVEFSATPEYLAAHRSWAAWTVLAGGLLLAALLQATLIALTGRGARVERLVAERTSALARAEERYALAVRGSRDGLWDWNILTGTVYYSPRFKELLGYAEHEGGDRYAFLESCIHPDDRPAVQQVLRAHFKEHVPLDIGFRAYTRAGELRWYHARGQAIWDENGWATRMAGSLTDITERKQAETNLQTVTAMRQAILDSANFSIIATDSEGVIRSFNKGAQRMLGYTEEEVVGKVTPALIHVPEEVVARATVLSAELGKKIEPGFEVFVAKTREGIPDENEWTYVRKGGSTFPVLLSVTALFDEAGAINGYLGIGYDITERRRAEQMKREFISTVSHELRTPLTAIKGALGLLVGGVAGTLPDKAHGLIDIAHKSSERLTRLINDILDIEKIESGKMEFRLTLTGLMSVVEQAIEANQAYCAQFGAQLTLTDRLGADVKVMTDPDRLTQVLTNLISNAAKFSPPGGTVSVSVTHRNDKIHIGVTDQGPGIPPAFHDRIFEKFSQADSSDTRAKGGTGLGLSISKAIVEKLGGEIGFQTQAGLGTTFYFDLREWQERAPILAEPGPGPRILIVEDSRDTAELLKSMLGEDGYRADIAYSAAQAKMLLAQYAYDAVTLDLILPDQDGVSLLRELRAQPATRALPVVVISVQARATRNSLTGGALAVADWLDKPIDPQRLAAAIGRAIHQATPARARILHVEDDPDMRQIVAALLHKDAELSSAETLALARDHLDAGRFDLVILDLILPDGSGFELLPQIEQQRSPVLVFSAHKLDPETARQVSATLVKSHVSHQDFVDRVKSLLEETASRA